VRQLKRFHGVKRLFENEQARRNCQLFKHLVPGIIGVGRADDDLDVGINRPNFRVVSTPSQPGGMRTSTNAMA
jgi:hypothetical protein